MLRKPQEEEAKQPGNRVKLPEESGIRPLAGFKEFISMAEESKGSQFELSWTTKTPGQRFVLDMQWEASKKAPFWTLYEETDGKSKRIWNEPLTIANIDMCYDILVMTCGGVEATTKNLAEILKPPPDQYEPNKPNSASKVSAAQTSDANKAEPANAEPANTSQAKSVADETNAGQRNNVPAPANPPAAFPAYMFPPGTVPPNVQAMGFPMPAYNMPMPPPVYPPNMQPNMQGMPANTWPYGDGSNLYAQANMAMPPMQNMPGSRSSMEPALASLPVDTALINKEKDISLVDLIVQAELITETTLAAALKMQELINSGEVSWEKAVDILKHQHNKGENIESHINVSQQEEDLAVFALLEQAGLISQNDMNTAKNVIKKHGGDIVTVLKAANKLDDKTLEAAKICSTLQTEGLMKVEQSVILVNYCSRSRVNFEEALGELNWPDSAQTDYFIAK